MRVDLVFPRFKLLSGAERLILELARALLEAGHRPRVVCHRFDPSCEALLAAGVALAVTGLRLDWSRNRYVNAAFDYGRVLRLRRLLDPDADAVVVYGPALPLGWYLNRLSRCTAAVVYHCFEPPRVLYQDREQILQRLGLTRLPVAAALGLYRAVDRRLVRAVDAISASGPYAAARVREVYGRDATPITHGIDRARFDRARGEGAGVERAAGPPILLTVNYLHPRKRVDMVIEALAVLLREREAAAAAGASGPVEGVAGAEGVAGGGPDGGSDREAPLLEVVGDGPERPALQALAARLGIADHVRFAGFVPEHELARHYWRASCYLHAGKEESFGLSVIEAAYCELPVVAVEEGGVTDNVQDGVTGALVPATASGLAEGIEQVLSRPDGGRALGSAGRAWVDAHYRWERGGDDLLAAIRAAL